MLDRTQALVERRLAPMPTERQSLVVRSLIAGTVNPDRQK